MDRLVFYLCYSPADGTAFAQRVTAELQRFSAPVAVLPDPDQPARSGVPWIGGCDAVLYLLTPDGVRGRPGVEAELARAAELGRPLIVVREDGAVRVPPAIVARELTLPRQPTDAEREPLRRLVRELGSPEAAVAEQQRALAGWQATAAGRQDPAVVDPFALAPIRREIALHEARRAVAGRPDRAELRQVETRFAALVHDRGQPGRSAGSHLPDLADHRPGLDDLAHEVVTGLAAEGRTLLTLSGSPGIGKTAVAGELRTLLSAVAGEPVPVLLASAYGNAPLTATMLLEALATVADAPAGGDALSRLVGDRTQSWVARFDQVLEALGTRPVVLVVDDADHLFELTDRSVRGRRFVDLAIRGMLRGSLTSDRHRLQWLLVGRELPDLRPLERRRGQVGTVRLGRLSPGDGEQLLRSLDPEQLVGLRDANEQHLNRLHELTDGRPRALELVFGVLRAHPAETVPSLLARLDRHAGDPQAVLDQLLDLVLDGLGRGHRAVVRALAAFAEPVSPEWVDLLLDGVLPGYPSAEALRQLTDLRVVRRYGDRFAVPRSECRRALARLPRGRRYDGSAVLSLAPLTEFLLYGRAAACFETWLRLADREPASIEDLEPDLRLVRLLVRAERFEDAVARMEALEKSCLVRWGQGHVLIPARHRLLGRFDHECRQAEAANRSRLAAAYTQLGEHEHAGRILDGIDRVLAPVDSQKLHDDQQRLWLQRAGNLYDQGYVNQATVAYRDTCADISADRLPGEKIRGHAGVMLCLGEQGDFTGALDQYEEARAVVRGHAAPPDAVAELKLNAASILAYAGRPDAARRTIDEVAAEAGEDVAIAGRCETARATFAIDDEDYAAAAAHAGNALAISERRHQIQVFREACNRLALAQLCAGRPAAAREAAQAAVRTPDSRRALGAFALRGLVAFREDDAATAVAALQTAAAQARHLVVRESGNFALLDWYGLVLCLLAHYEEEDLSLAVDIYRRARERTAVPLAVRRSVRLLGEVAKGRIEPGFLGAAITAARGSG